MCLGDDCTRVKRGQITTTKYDEVCASNGSKKISSVHDQVLAVFEGFGFFFFR